jgi:hypothetical protein
MRGNIVCVFLLKTIAMRSIPSIIFLLLVLIACKEQTTNTNEISTEIRVMSTAEKIAQAYGVDSWKDVSELQFTFNVDRKDQHFDRSFKWNPKTDDVLFMSAADTVAYNRKNAMDSIALMADKRFINDSYWLLSPFKLVWDTGTTLTETHKVIAPISKDTLDKLTIIYDNEGGYTPGDAYDFYYDNDFMIREWAYRQGNNKEASTITKWSDLKSFGKILFNTSHQDSLENFRLYFTNISVK